MISVIIVNFNSAHLTRRAVDSVFQEKEDLEVFVVDNTATAGEQELLHHIFDSREVTLLLNESNAGFAAACNQAFSRARGQFIFLLNPDAYVVPPCLSTLRKFMEDTPRAGSSSPLLYWDGAMTYLFPNSFPPSPADDFCRELSMAFPPLGRLYSCWGRSRNLRLWRSSSPVSVKSLSGGTVMLRRSAIEDSGGLFDERFFMFYEDNDLFLRQVKAGYDLYFVPQAKAVHEYRHSAPKLEMMSASRALYYEKHFRNHFLRRLRPLLPGPRGNADHTDSSWSTPPVFSVPPEFKQGYLFEWSPNRLFIPAVGFFGTGGTFIFSGEVWHSLDRGDYYSRFSDGRRLFSCGTPLFWRKV